METDQLSFEQLQHQGHANRVLGGDDTIFEAFVELVVQKRRNGLFTGLAALTGQEECYLVEFHQTWFFFHDGIWKPFRTFEPQSATGGHPK